LAIDLRDRSVLSEPKAFGSFPDVALRYLRTIGASDGLRSASFRPIADFATWRALANGIIENTSDQFVKEAERVMSP